MDEVLTTQQAADRLQVSKYTICRYIKKGVLPAAKPLPGSPYRIPVAAVDALVTTAVPEVEESAEVEEMALLFSPRSARSVAQQGRRRRRAAA